MGRLELVDRSGRGTAMIRRPRRPSADARIAVAKMLVQRFEHRIAMQRFAALHTKTPKRVRPRTAVGEMLDAKTRVKHFQNRVPRLCRSRAIDELGRAQCEKRRLEVWRRDERARLVAFGKIGNRLDVEILRI